MRRLIATALLLLLAAGFLAPAALATVTTPTPACCRGSGRHHCSAGITSDVQVRTESCPYRAPLVFFGTAAPNPATQTIAPAEAHPFLQEFYPEFFGFHSQQPHSQRAPPQSPSSK